MIAVVQRVAAARVTVGEREIARIGAGLAVLAAVHADDTEADGVWTAAKLVGLRIFRSGEKAFEADVRQAGGAILLVSNFTVAAQTRKGRRPSLDAAAGPEKARGLFEWFVAAVRREAGPAVAVETGEFGADMLVEMANDGPATFVVDSRPGRGGPVSGA